MRTTVILSLIILTVAAGCRRKGCTDPTANNYDSRAKKDDGSCDHSIDPATFDRGPMLTNIGDNLILPAYQNLADSLADLQTKFSAFSASPSTITLQDLRACWIVTLRTWQHAGYYEFGPAQNVALRATMNVYPTDTALVNSNISSGTYDLSSASNFDAKGLQALDYLLNGIGATDSDIVDMFTIDALASNRMTYVSDIVQDMKTAADYVLNEWSPSGNNYVATFKANDGLDIGGSVNMLFNAFMEHYEKYVRQGKLGIPAGALTFSQTPIPETVECYYHGNLSIDMLDEGLLALYNLYNGIGSAGNGVSFKEYLDYLETSGPTGLLSNDINTQISTARTDVTTRLTDPLSSFVVADQTTALEVWDELQLLVVYLKNDLKSAIGLSITYIDADGD